jgi:general secretion pathway protein D
MTRPSSKKLLALPLPALALLALLPLAAAGCAGNIAYRNAEAAAQQGNWDEAVLKYLSALDTDPGNVTYRAALLRAKIKASQAHFQKGQSFEKAGVLERALVEYQQAVQLDETNQYAAAQLEHVRRALVAQRQNRDVNTIDQMKARTRGSRPQPPVLNPRSTQPISLQFPQPVSIFQIYRALGQAFGINVIFDPNLKDQDIAIDLRDVTAQTGLETLMRAAGHFYKVIDEHTILIAADTPQNRRTYEDLVIQTFFLSNAEVKDMTTILRSLINASKIATNDQLNAIILRDTADKVKVAEKIIETNDKSKAEVVVDVELLQINTTKLRELGIQLSSYSVGQSLDLGAGASTTPAPGGTGGTGSTGGSLPANTVRVSDLYGLNQSNWLLTIPTFVYNFAKQNSDAQLLAKPQMRASEGEKANLVIGDKIPIPLTSFNTSNTVGGSIVPITSFTYQDVGIKIEIEPRVHHNQEITLKVKIDVSNLGAPITSNGQSQPTIGTRSFDSTIRLKDGETNFLAGLLRTDESGNDTGVPGLSDIPVLGRLFSNKRRQKDRTDLILTLTPHIIRNAEITEEDLLPIWAGTDANITFRPSPRVESDVEGPFDGNEGTPEEIQDQIRRRIQRLPRGLRPGETEGGQPPATGVKPPPPPAGINLAPAQPPSDIFRPPTPPGQQPNQPPQQPQVPPPVNEGSSGNTSGLLGVPAASSSAALLAQPAAYVQRAADAPAAGAAYAVYRPAEDGGGSAVGPAESTGAGSALAAGTGATPAGAGVSAAVLAASRNRRGGGAPVRLWLAPQQLDVAAGDSFQIGVQVSAEQPISHLPFTLEFDPTLLAVEKVEAGDFLGPQGTAQVLSDYSRPGALVVGASRMGEVPGVAGAGTVALVTFRALVAGSARIGFNGTQALDSQLRRVLPVAVRPARIEVGSGGGSGGGHQPPPAEPGKVPPAQPGNVPPPAQPALLPPAAERGKVPPPVTVGNR